MKPALRARMAKRIARLLAAVPFIAGIAVACAPEEEEATTGSGQNLEETTAPCAACLRDLVECASTSLNDADFVQCRDLFRQCQVDRTLAVGECENPIDEDACSLCAQRRDVCEGDTCETQYSVCKALLVSSLNACLEEGQEPVAEQTPATRCKTCLDGLAHCSASVAEGSDPTGCSTSFETCKADTGLTPEECTFPTGGRACDLCDLYQSSCELSGDSNCEAGYGSCVASLAPEGCDMPPPEQPAAVCEHNVCGAGEALTADCSPCATDICAADPYCCDTAWDDLCVAQAANVESCGCAVGCAHSECEAGEALDPTCSPCAEALCQEDPYCCDTEMDALCVSEAANIAECGCTTPTP